MSRKGFYGIHNSFVWAMLLWAFLSSCNTQKHLPNNQFFLRRNTITVTTPEISSKAKSQIVEQLYLIIPNRQRPNEYAAGMFPVRRWFYYKTDSTFLANKDKKTWAPVRWIGTKLSEPPVFYDSLKTTRHAIDMKSHLESMGYFKTNITVESSSGRNTTNVYYLVDVGPPTRITQGIITTRDSTLMPYIPFLQTATLMQPGVILSQNVYDLERQRIVRYFRDKGYYDFVPTDVQEMVADTAKGLVKVTLELRPPAGQLRHKATIGEVRFLQTINDKGPKIVTTELQHIKFIRATESAFVDEALLYERIEMKPGNIFNQTQFEEMGRRIDALGTFRFVNINMRPDSVNPSILHYDILAPSAKKMTLSSGLDLNFSTTSAVRSAFGGGYNGAYTHRNLMGGAEVLTVNALANLDLALKNDLKSSYDIRLDTRLKVPRLHGVRWGWVFLARLRLVNSKFVSDLRKSGLTTYSGGYNYLSLLDFYGYHSSTLSYGVQLQQRRTTYTIQQSGGNLFLPFELERFAVITNNLEFLKRSLTSQLTTGLVFHQISISHIGKKQSSRVSPGKFSLRLEQSGLEYKGGLAIYRQLSNDQTDPKLFGQVGFAQYLRAEGDYTRTHYLSGDRSIAYRGGGGLVVNLSDNQSVPYLKQLYLGGPYSIRAWRIRGLGPGAFYDPVSTNPSGQYPAYQTGDIKMEFGFEYRFPLFWQFESTLFVDGGNMWLLKKDPDRPGGELTSNFYRQIALGGGSGIRLDASFVVIRFDVAYPMRQPYPDPLGRYWEQPVNFDRQKVNYNIAIGYPF
jgi:outer membrane protein insertion porin family